jgi:tRNA-dihydrouridine synthase A
MMEWTDTHYRYFARLLSSHARLYTEMVTTGALLHGDQKRFLKFDASEHPIALQLGGSEPHDLSACARIGEDWGYDEINLNVGCPSDRVQSGRFGACLMKEPLLVADCVAAMQKTVKIPVTVKHRIGVDDVESFEHLAHFVEVVSGAGCQTFIVHARSAWLKGLSPKENREIPPLNYEMVYQLKKTFPALNIVINGGIETLDAITQQLQFVDGVMLGREAYHNPFLLAQIDNLLFDKNKTPVTREQVMEKFIPYIEQQLSNGTALNHITRHILGLYQGQTGARAFRRHISEQAHKPNASIEVVTQAMQYIHAY